ncbi:MAG: WYL domain-containing protein [Acidimicrobiia bacterium]
MSRLQASDQLTRLLTLIPWLAKNSPISLDEVAQRFDVTRKQLIRELSTVSLVGVPPFTPDTLIEVFFDDEIVELRLAQPFDRPLRLTPAEALSVFGAAQAMATLPGKPSDDPLRRALDKLESALDLGTNTLQVDLDRVQPEIMNVLQQGIAERRSVDIDYFSFARGERTERRIDPYRLSGQGGYWYLQSWCHKAEGHRVFRADRIESAKLTESVFEPIESTLALSEFVPSKTSPLVRLEVTNSAFRYIENYPLESVESTSRGTQVVGLRVAGEAWLARLLLGLGQEAKVVEAPENLLGVDRAAAARIINRYHKRETQSSSE